MAIDIKSLHANYQPVDLGDSRPQQPQNKGNFLTSLIPTGGGLAGGLAGAGIGTAILPGIGTILGGLLGGAIGGGGGKVAENAVEGNKDLGSGVAQEALINGVLSAGPLRLFKLGGEAVQGVRGGASLADAIANAGTKATESSLAKGAAQAVGKSVNTTAQRRVDEGLGLKVGQSIGGGKVMTPDASSELSDFIANGSQKYGGIRIGQPAAQAADAQNVFNNVNKSLESKLTEIDRPLQAHEPINIGANAVAKAKENAAITSASDTGVLKNFTNKIENAKSVKDLEAIRKEADDLAFKESGVKGSTSTAAQAGAARDAIDEFVTPLSSEYKSIKGDYGLAKDALKYTSKASNSAKGVRIPFIGGQVGREGLNGVINGGAQKAVDLTANTAAKAVNGYSPIAMGSRLATGVPVANGIANLFTGGDQSQPVPQTDASQAGQTDLASALMQAQGGQDTAQQSPYSLQNLMADIQRDPKNEARYVGLYSDMQKVLSQQSAAPASLSDTAIGNITDVESAIKQLGGLGQQLQSNPQDNPITGLVRQFNPYDTGFQAQQASIDQVRQIVGKALEGGVLRKEDEDKYRKILPTMQDTPEVAAAKIQNVMTQLQDKLSTYKGYQSQYGKGAGQLPDTSGGSSDLLTALLAAQGGQ